MHRASGIISSSSPFKFPSCIVWVLVWGGHHGYLLAFILAATCLILFFKLRINGLSSFRVKEKNVNSHDLHTTLLFRLLIPISFHSTLPYEADDERVPEFLLFVAQEVTTHYVCT